MSITWHHFIYKDPIMESHSTFPKFSFPRLRKRHSPKTMSRFSTTTETISQPSTLTKKPEPTEQPDIVIYRVRLSSTNKNRSAQNMSIKVTQDVTTIGQFKEMIAKEFGISAVKIRDDLRDEEIVTERLDIKTVPSPMIAYEETFSGPPTMRSTFDFSVEGNKIDGSAENQFNIAAREMSEFVGLPGPIDVKAAIKQNHAAAGKQYNVTLAPSQTDPVVLALLMGAKEVPRHGAQGV
ncbi:hypothetical protein QBC36DRAFT_321277 [Triangularia setosa]|uniref:Uncharacterized protein n=1 Tax=Triangularia setosa TaxID=2587417 RepID=A0AAN6WGY0_9PEZI|nr:hypothetical protein QBC36DRAFT_321277 [Podospora setosa]